MWNHISCNKLTEEKMRQKSYDNHVNKLRKIKAKIKISQPQQPWFIYAKKKKQLNRNQQLLQIEKQNHLLLSKIKNIEQRPNNTYKRQPLILTLNGKSMNETNQQIFKENRRICQKILKTQSFYKTQNIIQNSNNLQKLMQSISHNARRVQSARSLVLSKSKISRPFSGYTSRPKSSYSSNNTTKYKSSTGLGENQNSRNPLSIVIPKENNSRRVRPMSAPSTKKLKINGEQGELQNQQLK